ncbi:recombinase family protein [Sphaerisporangium album]|uniref:Recombinase family protein n=1 Tax=Sphaerisporangium album TaxID=509200 RepID=A0A367ESA9_9ACTN|nr:recombinase family protein [Sphaerisporangium album]RCG20070.1 recombinase family protein [Sphaerisporangium album]
MRVFVARRGWSLDEAHVLVENDTSAFKRRKIKLPNGQTELRTVRPKFRRALDLLATRQVDVLVVLDLDRLARQPRDLEDLIELVEASRFAVTCESLTGSCQLTSDAGITMARIMCAVANKSSKDTARRVSRARLRQAEAGQFGGGPRPYGFDADGITVRPQEAAEIVKMADLVLLPTFGKKGGPSVASIAVDLRARGVPSANGLPWRATTVRDVLLRPRNAALMVHKPGEGRKQYTPADVVARAPWEPIISEDTYWAIVAKLSDPSRRTNPGPAPRWLGSGAYRCPCGEVTRVHSAGGNANRPVYRCQATGKGHATCPQAALDDYVETVAIAMLARDAAHLIRPANADVDIPAMRAELIALRHRKAQLAEDYAETIIERPEYLKGIKKAQVKIDDIERRLAEVAEASPLAPFAGIETEQEAREIWKGLGVTGQREIIKAIMTVTLQPTGRGKRPHITERVTIEPITPTAA